MELAAVGVSIALFNQVSRIAIFPLVSVTTSFVAEEDAIGSRNPEAQDCDHLETGSTTNSEDKELIPRNGTLPLFPFFHALFTVNPTYWFSFRMSVPLQVHALPLQVDVVSQYYVLYFLYQVHVRTNTRQN